jgi:GH15 family glucan-1,4-alpha-glucosidase
LTEPNLREHLYRHSVEVILDNQQPSGAYLACPVMPDYQFSWFRDGAFISYALTVDGQAGGLMYGESRAAQWESASRFHGWCAGVIASRAGQMERSIQRAKQGLPLALDDTLNARYQPDGHEGPHGWPEFQLDGPGTWLWSLNEYVKAARLQPLPLAWERAVRIIARYLNALWQTPCYDCWEERGDDVHISTLAAIYAGLKAAQCLLPDLDFAETTRAIRDFVLSHGLTPGGELAKSVGRDMVDGNLIGVATPYRLLAPDDPVMRQTVARIERDLAATDGGIYRHREDVYYGGGPWVLLALWLAWYYADLGDRAKADEILTWVEAQTDDEGNLPEQVNKPLLSPDHYPPWVAQRGPIANPLLWCHAEYLVVRRALDGYLLRP